MRKQRRNFSGTEKMAILREHLIEKGPISEVCDKHGLQPTVLCLIRRMCGLAGACRPGAAAVATAVRRS
ncbi:MAG: transposase [Phycisphaerae bacterium]